MICEGFERRFDVTLTVAETIFVLRDVPGVDAAHAAARATPETDSKVKVEKVEER